MTTDERLAEIENAIAKVYHGTFNGVEKWFDGDADVDDVRWLIAEVRRLQALITTGKAIIHDIADGSEYRRGRVDERASVLAMIRSNFSCSGYEIKRAIERGEHVRLEAIERGEHVAEVKDAK